MSILLKVIILLCGFLFSGWIIRLLIRKKISERHSLVWLGGSFLILILSVNPEILNKAAEWLGVDYPPSLLFLFSVMVLLVMVLYQSIQISALHDKIKELNQFIALHELKDEMNQQERNAAIDSNQQHRQPVDP